MKSETVRAASIHKVKLQGAKNCYRCKGKNNNANKCHFKKTKCHNCGKLGQIKKADHSKASTECIKSRGNGDRKENTKYVTAEEDLDLEMFTVLTVRTSEDTDLYKTTFSFNDVDLEMEIDTAASKSVISEITYRRQSSHLPLQRAKAKLRAYNGGRISVRVRQRICHF